MPGSPVDGTVRLRGSAGEVFAVQIAVVTFIVPPGSNAFLCTEGGGQPVIVPVLRTERPPSMV